MQPVILDQWSCAETPDTGSLDTGTPGTGTAAGPARVTPAGRPAA